MVYTVTLYDFSLSLIFLFTQGSSQSSLKNSKLINNGLFRVAPEKGISRFAERTQK